MRLEEKVVNDVMILPRLHISNRYRYTTQQADIFQEIVLPRSLRDKQCIYIYSPDVYDNDL